MRQSDQGNQSSMGIASQAVENGGNGVIQWIQDLWNRFCSMFGGGNNNAGGNGTGAAAGGNEEPQGGNSTKRHH